jgi:hypothetical protein
MSDSGASLGGASSHEQELIMPFLGNLGVLGQPCLEALHKWPESRRNDANAHLGSQPQRALPHGAITPTLQGLSNDLMRQRAVDLPFLHSGRRGNDVQSTAAYSFKLSASAVGYLGVTQTKENDREA